MEERLVCCSRLFQEDSLEECLLFMYHCIYFSIEVPYAPLFEGKLRTNEHDNHDTYVKAQEQQEKEERPNKRIPKVDR